MKSTRTFSALAGACAVVLWTAAALAQVSPAADLNNDGAVTAGDVTILTSCALGTCSPAAATLCGGAGLGAVISGSSPSVRCGDTFGDGNTTSEINNDLAVLVRLVAGLQIDYTPAGASVGSDRAGCTGTLPTCSSGTCVGGSRSGAACGDETDCPSIEIAADITASEVWPSTCRVMLTDTVEVSTPAAAAATTVLTIEKGTQVVGDTTAVGVPALIIAPGARIVAIGTEAEPIVFTSNNAPRAANDWGGLNLNGRSTVNRPGCVNEAEGLPFQYGGCVTDDNSGIVTYARVEFAGRLFTPDNELNNFTLNGVGSGTRVSYVQAHFGADDCIEWFGGTVETDHLVASQCGDDGFDWQLGFTGAMQFGLYVHSGGNLSAGSSQSRGIEADNSEFGFNDLPRSRPQMCNVTLVGSTAAGHDRGMILRRGSAGNLANFVVTGFKNEGVNLNDADTTAAACNAGPVLTGNTTLSSSVIYATGGGGTTYCSGGSGNCTTSAWCGLQTNLGLGTNVGAAGYPGSGDLYNTVLATPGAFSVTTGACSAINGNFVDTTYVGAFNPSLSCTVAGTGAGTDCDWLSKPWNNFDS